MANPNKTDNTTSVADVLKTGRKRSPWKAILWLVLLAGIAGAAWYVWQQNNPPSSKVVFVTEALQRGNLSTAVTATGNLKPRNKVDIGTELSGTVAEVLVEANDVVKKGQVLARLNTDQLEDTITKAQAALASAEAKVAQAKVQIAQADAKIIQSQASVRQAQANAQQSTAQIDQVSAQIAQQHAQIQQANAQIQQADAQVEQAKATVLETRSKLNRLQALHKDSGGKLPAKADLEAAVAAWQRAVAAENSAKSSATSARASLQQAKAGLLAAKANVESSKASSGASQANVEGVKASADATKAEKIVAQASLEAANASVIEAKASLRSAQSNLAKAIIKSPIDGVVLTRAVESGQTVASSLSAPTLFTLAEDLAQMELQVSVDEADVGQVKEWQRAEFTVDAWPGRKYKADITRVSLGSTMTDNVVSYLTNLTVENADLTLRPGMTAVATITTQQREDVLLVPNTALRFRPPLPAGGSQRQGQAGQGGRPEGVPPTPPAQQESFLSKLMPKPPMRPNPNQRRQRPDGAGGRERDPSQQRLWVLEQGQPKPIRIQVGISDGKFTEVTGGDLQAGMEVVTDSREAAP